MDNIFLYVTHLDGQQHGQAGLCIGHAGAEVGLAPVQPLVAEQQPQLGAGPPPQVHPLPWCAACNVEHCNIGQCTETKEAENGISAFSISTFFWPQCGHTTAARLTNSMLCGHENSLKNTDNKKS